MLPDTPQRKNRHRGKLIATAMFALTLLAMKLLGIDYDFMRRALELDTSPTTQAGSTLTLLGLFAANAYIVIVLLLGCIIDSGSIMLIVLPLLLPVARSHTRRSPVRRLKKPNTAISLSCPTR